MFQVAPKTKAETRRTFFVLLAAFMLAAPMSYLFTRTVHHVTGVSMSPTLGTDNIVVVLWPWGTPEVGDIVILEHAEEKRWVKRVVGAPGDHIVITKGVGRVIRNGVPLVEPYLNPAFIYYLQRYEVTLGPDEFFVLGDNRMNSYDSRYVGPILADEILVSFALWFQL